MKELACRILLAAVADLLNGGACDARCGSCCHYCADDARRFLLSDWAEVLFDLLGIDRARALEALGI